MLYHLDKEYLKYIILRSFEHTFKKNITLHGWLYNRII